MRIIIFLALISVLLSSGKTVNSTLNYDVIRNGNVIGYLNASRINSGNQIEYITESTVSVKILMTFSMYSKVTGAFRNGMLFSGSAVRKVNGNNKVNTVIQWKNDHYLLEEEDNTQKEIREKITYTTACLFNQEPVGLTRIFSENFGKFITLKEVRPHYYELHLPDGNRNYYSYSNGICTGAEVNTNYTKAFFRLKR
jgi:hypothetical protein